MSARTPEASFPLGSFRDAAPHLRRPFTPEAVRFKVQATWQTGGLIVGYIDARLASERLNLIVPGHWSDRYEPAPWLGPKFLVCHLTVDGITRSDVGEGDGKGRVSDALKRAAVKFGVGVSLYAVPKMTLNVGAHLKEKKGKLELTPEGEREARKRYRQWLESRGIKSFGEPLDHGDVEDAQGDAETDTDPPVAAVKDNGETLPPAEVDPPKPPDTPQVATAEDVKMLTTAARGLTVQQLKGALAACGVEVPDPFVPKTMFLRVPQHKCVQLYQQLGAIHREEEKAA